MKLRAAIALIYFLGGAAATFAQDEHLIKDREIPLDDFPATVDGYRIQIGAFSSQSSAVQLKEKFKSQMTEKIHLSCADGLWRVRVGDFQDSTVCANCLRSNAALQEFADALVVMDNIPIPASSLPLPEFESGYRLQLDALKDSSRAMELARNAACIFPDLRPHVVVQASCLQPTADSLYKVQLGDFRERSHAEAWRAEVEQVEDPLVVEAFHPIVVPAEVYGATPPSVEKRTPDSDIFNYDD